MFLYKITIEIRFIYVYLYLLFYLHPSMVVHSTCILLHVTCVFTASYSFYVYYCLYVYYTYIHCIVVFCWLKNVLTIKYHYWSTNMPSTKIILKLFISANMFYNTLKEIIFSTSSSIKILF